MNGLKVWCDAALSLEAETRLREGLSDCKLVFSESVGNNLSASGFSDNLVGADVAFGQPDPRQVIETPSVRYVQITSAGFTRYDTPSFRNYVRDHGLTFANSSSVYADPCAQHALAFILAAARQIPDSIIEQNHSRGWIFDRLRPVSRVLTGSTVLIVGYGAIAKRLNELLQPFRTNVVALRRDPRGDEDVKTHRIDQLNSYLGKADYVVNVLPANDSTYHLFGVDQFAHCKHGAVFVNIGRGNTVDQTALAAALAAGKVDAALLDVTDPEPLPSVHPLWRSPNCVITPHIAGGFQGEHVALVNHFLANLDRFRSGAPMEDVAIS